MPALEHVKSERVLLGEAEAESLLQEGRERLSEVYSREDRELHAQLATLKQQCGLQQHGEQQQHMMLMGEAR